MGARAVQSGREDAHGDASHSFVIRVGEEIGPEVESGGEVDEEFYEDNLGIDNGTIMKKIEAFREHLEQMKTGPERMEKLSRKLDELEKEVQPDVLPHQDEVLERPMKIDESNIVSMSRSRKQTVPDHTWNKQWGTTLMMQRVLRVFAVSRRRNTSSRLDSKDAEELL